MIGECRPDGAGVVRRNGFAKREVRGQHTRRQLELLGVLLEQACKHALADVEFFGDLCLGIAGSSGVHEPERGHLHEGQQRHEQHDDACLQALDAHQDPASRAIGIRTRPELLPSTSTCISCDLNPPAGAAVVIVYSPLGSDFRVTSPSTPLRANHGVSTMNTQATMVSWMLQPSTASPVLSNSMGAASRPEYSLVVKVLAGENE